MLSIPSDGRGAPPDRLTGPEVFSKNSARSVDPAPARSTTGQNGGGHEGRATVERQETAMRYMAIVKASEASESGELPTTEDLAEMGAFNEELVKAGVMLAGEGLTASSQGARVQYDKDGRSTVVDGPFAETKELIAGFWILQVSSREEALEWIRKAPFREGEVEVRRIAEAEDFGEALTPELREQEEQLRAQSGQQPGA
jgi:hypothetical protein